MTDYDNSPIAIEDAIAPRHGGLGWKAVDRLPGRFASVSIVGRSLTSEAGVRAAVAKLTAWLDAPRLAAPSSPRFFRISTDGSTPTWTIIAASPSEAWRLWVGHEERSGYLDGEACSAAAADVPSFFLVELTDAASRIVDDDGTRRPLSECAIGSVFCSEY